MEQRSSRRYGFTNVQCVRKVIVGFQMDKLEWIINNIQIKRQINNFIFALT